MHQKFYLDNSHAFPLLLNMEISLDIRRSNRQSLFCLRHLQRHLTMGNPLYGQIHRPHLQMHHTHLPVQQALWQEQDHIHMNNRHTYSSLLYNCKIFLLNCNSDQDRLKIIILKSKIINSLYTLQCIGALD